MIATAPFFNPAKLVSHFYLRPGDKVADFGAGRGYFLPALADRVTPDGEIFACEIQRPLIGALGSVRAEHKMKHTHCIWCDVEERAGSTLSEASLDTVIMINAFFQMFDHEAALEEVRRVLRPGGKFFLVDWRDSFLGIGPASSEIVLESEAVALAETAGFVLDRTFDAGFFHYGLALRG